MDGAKPQETTTHFMIAGTNNQGTVRTAAGMASFGRPAQAVTLPLVGGWQLVGLSRSPLAGYQGHPEYVVSAVRSTKQSISLTTTSSDNRDNVDNLRPIAPGEVSRANPWRDANTH